MRRSVLGPGRAPRGRPRTALAAPFDPPAIFAAAREGDALAREVVREEARRIALHIAAIAAVTDVGLVVLGGGIGANADLLTDVRPLLDKLAALRAATRDLEPRRRGGARWARSRSGSSRRSDASSSAGALRRDERVRSAQRARGRDR